MRGKVVIDFNSVNVSRITPAYAGKSRKPVHRRKPMQDHPRLCGEKPSALAAASARLGSPPPMRGKGCCDSFLFGMAGITPAYAGKSYE